MRDITFRAIGNQLTHRWLGYLGALGSYMALWAVLSIQTVNTLSAGVRDKDSDREGYKAQQIEWYNLLAIWLWRCLFSTVEGVSVPGVVSVIGLVLTYLPTYFLWQSLFMLAMLITEKTGSSGVCWSTEIANSRWQIRGMRVCLAVRSHDQSPKRPADNART